MCSNRSASLGTSKDGDGERCGRLRTRVHTCARVRARGSPAPALETRWRQIKPSPFSGAKHSNCLTRGAWEENKKPGSYSGGGGGEGEIRSTQNALPTTSSQTWALGTRHSLVPSFTLSWKSPFCDSWGHCDNSHMAVG